jgi:hypothetical protein
MRRLPVVCACFCLLASALLSGTALASPPPDPPGIVLGVGHVQPVVDSAPAGQPVAFPFHALAGGTISDIDVYVDSTNQASKVTVGLYSAARRAPAKLLSTGSGQAPQNGAWNTFPITPVDVPSGSSYWIAVLGTGGAVAYRDRASACTGAGSTQADLSAMPGSFGTATQLTNCRISAYATAAPPAASTAPVLSGTAVQGGTITTSNGTWQGDPQSYDYQWQDCDTSGGNCADVNGATAQTYTLGSTDVAHEVRAVITATNLGGSSSAPSKPTGKVTGQCTTTISSGLASALSSAAGGSTICLNAGSYGSVNVSVQKSAMVTVVPAPGVSASQAVLGWVNTGTSSNLTFTGLTVGGFQVGAAQSASGSHIHFIHDVITAPSCIYEGTNNEDVLIDHDSFNALGRSCTEGRLGIENTASSGRNGSGVVISNSVFQNEPSNSANASDGIQLAYNANGVQVGPGNVFNNFNEGTCGTTHCDPIQFYGAGTGNVITGNFFCCNNSDGGIFISNSGGYLTLTQNIFGASIGNDPVMAGGTHDVVDHNTFTPGWALDQNCDNMSGVCPTNETDTNDIMDVSLKNGYGTTSESTWTVTDDLSGGSLAGSGSVSGKPTFSGGTHPASCLGFQLASSSLGKGAAAGGSDMGVTQWSTSCPANAGP